MNNVLGILSPSALREELQKAVMEGNTEDIEDILDKCIAAGMPELDSDIENARSKLDERRKYEGLKVDIKQFVSQLCHHFYEILFSFVIKIA